MENCLIINGKHIPLSEETAKNIEDSFKESKKGWWDAFIEYYNTGNLRYIKYSEADCLKITYNGSCTSYRNLMAYVIKFDYGGFWYDKTNGLTFVTNGIDSDDKATYEDAKTFIKGYK